MSWFILLSQLALAAPSPPGVPVQEAKAAGVSFKWTIEDGLLLGEASAPTDGWVAVGFNSKAELAGSRLVMGWASGETSGVEEHIAAPPDHAERTSLGRPPGLRTAEATESGGRTTLRFSLVLDTGHPEDPVLRGGEPVHIVLAWSHEDELQHHSAQRSAVDTRL